VGRSVSNTPDQSRSELTEFISKVFDELKHTPVTAIRHNFIFEGRSEDIKLNFSYNKKDLILNGDNDLGVVRNLNNEVTFEREDNSKINIYLIANSEKSTIQMNFHYEISDTNEVVSCTNNFEKNLESAQEILKGVTRK